MTMTLDRTARVVMEFWRAAEPRDLPRLRRISSHMALVHGHDAAELTKAAEALVLPHERGLGLAREQGVEYWRVCFGGHKFSSIHGALCPLCGRQSEPQ